MDDTIPDNNIAKTDEDDTPEEISQEERSKKIRAAKRNSWIALVAGLIFGLSWILFTPVGPYYDVMVSGFLLMGYLPLSEGLAALCIIIIVSIVKTKKRYDIKSSGIIIRPILGLVFSLSFLIWYIYMQYIA